MLKINHVSVKTATQSLDLTNGSICDQVILHCYTPINFHLGSFFRHLGVWLNIDQGFQKSSTSIDIKAFPLRMPTGRTDLQEPA